MKRHEKTYSTGNGIMKTQYESEIHLSLPEFSDSKIINWKFSVEDSENIGYDMIIGRDLMMQLKINFSFENKSVSWEGIEIPMRDFNRLKKWNISQRELKTIMRETKSKKDKSNRKHAETN